MNVVLVDRVKFVIRGLLVFLLAAFGFQAVAAERVFVNELQGIWLEKNYLDTLKSTKSPHVASSEAKPMLIAVRKEGRVYPYFATDLNQATLMIVFDVEPGEEEDTYRLVLGERNAPTSAEDIVYVWFKGTKDADGQFRTLEIKEPLVMKGKWATFVRGGRELGPIINGIAIAGEYLDSDNKQWIFTNEGAATFPGKSPFYYEVSLTADGANCDYIEAEDLQSETGITYYGYRWTQSSQLSLFAATLVNDKVRCEKEPFAVLTPR